MNIPFKPLEESLGRLEKLAKEGRKKRFVDESVVFYHQLSVLERHQLYMGQIVPEMIRHYQSRYEQVKFILDGSSRTGQDVGQMMPGSD